jgi:hypothetical protein
MSFPRFACFTFTDKRRGRTALEVEVVAQTEHLVGCASFVSFGVKNNMSRDSVVFDILIETMEDRRVRGFAAAEYLICVGSKRQLPPCDAGIAFCREKEARSPHSGVPTRLS